jgi:hypothetical protein
MFSLRVRRNAMGHWGFHCGAHGRMGVSRLGVVATIGVVCLAAAIALPFFAVKFADQVEINRCGNTLSSMSRALGRYRSAHDQAWPVASTEPVDAVPASTRHAAALAGSRRGHAGYGWMVTLLPYWGFEHDYDNIASRSADFKLDAFDPSIRIHSGEHASMDNLRSMRCDAIVGEDGPSTVSNAPEYRRFAAQFKPDDTSGVALTNYVAMSATHLALTQSTAAGEPPRPNGVIAYFADGKRISSIPDGDTHTIVITETCEPGYASWYDGTTSWVVARDPNSPGPELRNGRWACDEATGCRTSLTASLEVLAVAEGAESYYRREWAGETPWRYGPSSMHGGGLVNHLFADGRTVAIRGNGPNRISANVYLALVTRDGNEGDKVE